MEAWDVVVIGSGHAALRAALAAGEAGSNTLVLGLDGLGGTSCGDGSGIAASVTEPTTKGHRDDTIRAGDFLCDQDIVSARTGAAVHLLAELEQWGANFRRDAEGLPMTTMLPGHGRPRVTGCGDSTDEELIAVLENRCLRNGISRRGDHLVLELVHTDHHMHGLVSLDLTSGEVVAIQTKSVIIADTGFQGAWTGHESGGWGMHLAMQAGVLLKDLEFQSWTPLGVPDSDVVLPIGLLAEGATLQGPGEATGDPVQMSASMVDAGSGWSLDMATLDGDAPVWFSSIQRLISDRLGLDPGTEPIPVEPRVDTTLGGIPVDEHGRVMLGGWGTWFTGLYSAGDAACSGMHGAGSASGNQLLDSIAGGAAAGSHAAEHSAASGYTGGEMIEVHRTSMESLLNNSAEDDSSEPRPGTIRSALAREMSSAMGLSRQGATLASATKAIAELDGTIMIDHSNGLLMNLDLVESLRLQAMVNLAGAAVSAAANRDESRGGHRRDDHGERNDAEFLHHSLVTSDWQVSSMPLRISASGSWILPPE